MYTIMHCMYVYCVYPKSLTLPLPLTKFLNEVPDNDPL